MRKIRVTSTSYSLSPESRGKLERVSYKLNRSQSQTLERILMSLSEKSMEYHARKKPLYMNEGVLDEQNEHNIT